MELLRWTEIITSAIIDLATILLPIFWKPPRD